MQLMRKVKIMGVLPQGDPIIAYIFLHLNHKNFIRASVLAILWLYTNSLAGMVYDNRYFPLLQYPYITITGNDSYITGDFFVTTASRATDDRDREIGIPELSGPFDQAQLAKSFVLAGLPDPLTPGQLDGELPWVLHGKLQTQGFAFSYRQDLMYGFSLGLYTMAMRSNSTIDYVFNTSKASSVTPILTESDIFALDEVRRSMLATLGLACNHVHQRGMGDTELYLRWSDNYDFCLKLRSLDCGLRLGTLIPTGVKRNIFQPASVPFGGNGHWGIYASGDAELELKEDWKVGLLLRGSKRFAKTRLERMPVDREPQIFGVVTGLAKVDPGYTGVFSAYTQWEGIRQGLGVRLQYTLIAHSQDHWTDERVDKTIPVNLKPVDERSNWASEYVSLSAFWDFNKESLRNCYRPIVRGVWDIPFTLLVGHRFVHSYKVSLGLEFVF